MALQKEPKDTWVFPKIMVPPNHPFVHRVFHYFHHPFTEQIEIIAEDPTIDVYVQVQNLISCPFRFSDFYDSEFQDIRHFAKLVPLQAVYESMHGPASPDEVKVVHGNAVVVKPAHGAVPPCLAMQQP